MKKQTRTLSPYEETQLARYGHTQEELKNTTAPVEHITQKAEFFGHVFTSTPDALIPRIETEELVSLALSECQKRSQTLSRPITICDVGTGSGALIISLVYQLQKESCAYSALATDISQSALNLARKNASDILTEKNDILFKCCSLLEEETGMFDCIVANLPYIPTQRIAHLDASVKDHEPHLALDGGPDGLHFIRLLLTQAESLLTSKGILLLEIDHTHTQNAWREFESVWKVELTQDSFNQTRFARVTKK